MTAGGLFDLAVEAVLDAGATQLERVGGEFPNCGSRQWRKRTRVAAVPPDLRPGMGFTHECAQGSRQAIGGEFQFVGGLRTLVLERGPGERRRSPNYRSTRVRRADTLRCDRRVIEPAAMRLPAVRIEARTVAALV